MTEKKKSSFKKYIIIVIIIIVFIIILLPKFLSTSDELTGQNPGQRLNREISVNVYVIEPETINNTVLSTGSILANEEVELRSETSGMITKINFREGSYVNKGDLLVKINDAELQAQLRRAESRLKLAEEKEFRQRSLLERNLISQEEYDNALSEFNISKAEYDLTKAQIDKTEITAPFSGIIGLRSVSEGSFVTASTLIARLQNLSALKIDFSIPERYATSVRIGDELQFGISGKQEKFKAKVYAIEPRIDPSTRTLQIRAICEPHSELIPGSFADVHLNLQEISDALLVPSVSIVPELKGQKVYLYKSGTVVSQSVELGIRQERKVQVVSGLNAGDTIITSGILQIRDGAQVSVAEIE